MISFPDTSGYTNSLSKLSSIDILTNIKNDINQSINKLTSSYSNDFEIVMNNVSLFGNIHEHIIRVSEGLLILSEKDKNGSNQAIYTSCLELMNTKKDYFTDLLYVKLTYSNIKNSIFLDKAKFFSYHVEDESLSTSYNTLFVSKLLETDNRFIIESNNIFQSCHSIMNVIKERMKDVNISSSTMF